MHHKAGSTLKKYSVLREFALGDELGRGGYATVFLATPTGPTAAGAAPPSPRAVKELNLKRVNDIAALEDEIKTLRRLDHPNVVRLYDCYLTTDDFFMVLDLCRGGELFDRILAREHYSERQARIAFAQLCEAVGHCHRHEVVHRDVKPENALYADVAGAPQGELLKLVVRRRRPESSRWPPRHRRLVFRFARRTSASRPAVLLEESSIMCAARPDTSRRTSCLEMVMDMVRTCGHWEWSCTSCCAATRRSTTNEARGGR
jgi:hypothetical protein